LRRFTMSGAVHGPQSDDKDRQGDGVDFGFWILEPDLIVRV
jgi:hypothetical protein